MPSKSGNQHTLSSPHNDRPIEDVQYTGEMTLPPTSTKPGLADITMRPPPVRPSAQSRPTTALSSVDIHTLTFPDGTRGTISTPSGSRTAADTPDSHVERKIDPPLETKFRGDDSFSVNSVRHVNQSGVASDLASLMGADYNPSPAMQSLASQAEALNSADSEGPETELDDDPALAGFEQEFDELPEVDTISGNEEQLLLQFKSKLKHYMILSSAGKPIYSRHGDLSLINSYIGIVHTIISFYEGGGDPLQSFVAGSSRFVIASKGPLYFVAISSLGESEAQLRAQLEALYMQILSTLTLPRLTSLFSNRPSTDLRRPLEGTETLISSLADTFTRGSMSGLLSSLECLKIRKSHRAQINHTLLKSRCSNLLYGLIVAGGRLVSVVRPKRHSLHPGDLQLIFNMLFEARSIRSGGGENWIPLCLPGFNNTGFLYMYVSFLPITRQPEKTPTSEPSLPATDEEIAILLISAEKESFYELKSMRDEIVAQITRNGMLAIIADAVRRGRPKPSDVAPGTSLRHWVYKSKANVQFVASSSAPHYANAVSYRKLLNQYHKLHAQVHAKNAHLRILHEVGRASTSLAWVTPEFEFYCVAGPSSKKQTILLGANKVVQWVRSEQERLFIIGGAVF